MRLLPVLFVCAASAAAQADNLVGNPGAPFPTTVDFTRSTGMGGAHAAISTSNDALVTNPAGLSQAMRYHFEADGVLDARFPAQGLDLSIVDSKSTAPVGGGLLFSRWGSGQPAGRGEGWLAGIGYSTPLAEGVWVGGVTKYLRFHTPDGLVAKWAQDFGALVRRGSFSWGAVLHNVSTHKLPLFPPTATAGIAWGDDASWHLAFDYKADLSDLQNPKNRFALGGEALIDQTFAIRAGGNWDPTNHQWFLSLGGSLLTEIGALQLAWRRQMTGGNDLFLEAGLVLYVQ